MAEPPKKRNPLRRLRIQRQQSIDSDSTRTIQLFRGAPRFRRQKNRHSNSSIIPSSISYDQDQLVYEESTIDEDSMVAYNSLDATAIQKPALPTATTKIAIIHTDSLPSALALWGTCARNLFQTQEFQNLLSCSCLVFTQTQHTAWHVLLLPVTVPRNICVTSMRTICQNANQVIVSHQQQHENPLHPLALPALIVGLTTKLVWTVVSPVLLLGSSDHSTDDKETTLQSRAQQKQKSLDDAPVPDYLDRLRLDYGLPKCIDDDGAPSCHKSDPSKTIASEQNTEVVTQRMSSSGTTSKYLLRVDDLDIQEPTGQVAYLDLDQLGEASNDLLCDALQRLVTTGLGMASTNDDVPIDYESSVTMQWNPEGATRRLLRNLDNDVLLRETLIWSGRAKCCKPHPFFLARGAIPMSPLDLLHLLWDNTRTSEYNNFCMGRSTLLSISHDDADVAILSQNAPTATKVIKSEMRVPFAGFTVRAVCLMHVTALTDGYAILSRTLDAGESGHHMAPCTSVERSSNEILWGCNILRPSTSNPMHTDLISMSQVGSNVPGFLSQKIGLMGISDFFRNVRSLR